MSGWAFSPRARADLSEIWDYTAERWGIEQADRYAKQIVSACSDLATGVRIGRSIDQIRAGYWSYRVGSHLLFYRKSTKAGLLVVRVLHERMDIEHHL